MTRKRWILVVAVLGVALLGTWWWKARSSGAAPKYRTAEVDRGNIESVVSATGTVSPVVQVEIGSQVSGTVARLGADFNSRVRAGQVIVELELSSFKAREAEAEAAVTRAEASVKDAERAQARAQELFAKTYISQADLDAATVAVELRKADLKQARAQLQAARVDVAHATIRSPIDGVVISRSIDLGQTVAASLQAPKLFVIANDLSRMQVESRIDEADIGRLKPGLPVSFTVDAFPDRTFEGRVEQVRLEPIVDQAVVTYTTVIQTANPDLMLRPGMTANVSVEVDRRDDVVRIPNAALRFRPPADEREHKGRARGASASAAERGGNDSGEARAAVRGEGTGARGDGAALRGGNAPAGAGGERGRGRGRGARRHHGAGAAADSTAEMAAGSKPATVYVLRAGKPHKVKIMTGITDGSFTEVRSGELQPGDVLIVGSEGPARAANNLQPPPGMGGPQFRGPGGGRGGRR